MRRDVFEVIATGPAATLQDAGRPGHAASGIGPAGAADLPALRLANRLAGTEDDAPAIEVVIGGFEVLARRTVLVAVTGAPRRVTVDGRPVPTHAPVVVRAGQRVHVATGGRGVFTYLAVEGGIAAELVLGSASHDTLSGLGAPPLRAGDVLATAGRTVERTPVDVAPVVEPPREVELLVHPGPRLAWFAPDALALLCATTWEVTPASNRVGLRLAGPVRLGRTRPDELPSEGVVRGAVQVPPDGFPVVLGPDHPVTGGYPVPAVVDASCLAAAAQCEPGRRVRFRLAPRRG